MSTVAVVGLGHMGLPMCRRLIGAGHVVRGFDLRESERTALTLAGGSGWETASEAATGADVVILMLPDSSVVEAVVHGPGFLEALTGVLVDMSSSEPSRTRRLAEELGAWGVPFVDAPVSGGVSGATQGTLTVMVGGPDEVVAKVLPVLDAFGRVRHVGAIGAGHALKALNNLMSATHLLITAEAVSAAERFGIDTTVLLDVVNGSSGRSGSTEAKWPKFVQPGTFDSGFALRLMLKDMRIAAGLAEEVGVPHALADRAVALWASAADELSPTADHTEIARWVRDRSAEEAHR